MYKNGSICFHLPYYYQDVLYVTISTKIVYMLCVLTEFVLFYKQTCLTSALGHNGTADGLHFLGS
jgi:hypothetical protein